MTLYILLIVFSILMVLIALGFTIGGLVKKNQKVWISSLIGLVVFSLVCVFAIILYAKETYNYMGSEEFQEETKKTAQTWGENIGNTITGAAKGLESTLDEESITKLADKSATVVGKGVVALSDGFDKTVGKTTIFADESLEALGIKIGRGEETNDTTGYQMKIYLDFEKDFEGDLNLSIYDSEGLKQNSKSNSFSQKAGDGAIFSFHFEDFEPGLSGYCILAKK